MRVASSFPQPAREITALIATQESILWMEHLHALCALREPTPHVLLKRHALAARSMRNHLLAALLPRHAFAMLDIPASMVEIVLPAMRASSSQQRGAHPAQTALSMLGRLVPVQVAFATQAIQDRLGASVRLASRESTKFQQSKTAAHSVNQASFRGPLARQPICVQTVV